MLCCKNLDCFTECISEKDFSVDSEPEHPSTLLDSVTDSNPFIPCGEVCVIKHIAIDTMLCPFDLDLECGKMAPDPVRILNIKSSGRISRILRNGDFILSVNEIPLNFMDKTEVLSTIESCKPYVYFNVRRRISTHDLIRIKFHLEICDKIPTDSIKGVPIINWKEPSQNEQIFGLYILETEPNGFFARFFQEGDIVVAINNRRIYHRNFDAVISDMYKSKCSLHVDLYRYKSHILPGNLLYFYQPIFRNNNEEYVSDSLIKVYLFLKRNGLYGLNVVGGYEDYPIFVSNTDEGTVGFEFNIYSGEQILKINNLEVSLMSQNEFVRLTRDTKVLTIVSVDNISGLKRFFSYVQHISKTNEFILNNCGFTTPYHDWGQLTIDENPVRFIARALFSYNPSFERRLPSKGLAFKFGDLLYVHNGNGQEWWKAELLDRDGNSLQPSSIGIIPSSLVIKCRKIAQDKKVHFSKGKDIKKTSITEKNTSELIKGHFTASFHRMNQNSQSTSLANIKSYDIVMKIPYDTPRPVIFLGANTEKMIAKILTDFSDNFCLCPIQTTSKGLDENKYINCEISYMERIYNQNKYIDFCSDNNEYFGINIDHIEKIILQKKNPILCVSYHAVKKLQARNIYPIVILLKIENAKKFLEGSIPFTRPQILEISKNIEIFEKYHIDTVSEIIIVDDFSAALKKVIAYIKTQKLDYVWISVDRSTT